MKIYIMIFLGSLIFAGGAWAGQIVSDQSVMLDAVSGEYGSIRTVRFVEDGLAFVVSVTEGRGPKFFYQPKQGISASVSPLWGGAVYETYLLDGALAVYERDPILGSSLSAARETHTVTVECASSNVQRSMLETIARKYWAQ